MYLFIDTETGGLDPTMYSLLTISCDLVENIGEAPISQFAVKIRHDPYQVSASALSVNGINLEQHHERAIDAQDARDEFVSWLVGNVGLHKPQPVGWNLPFDLGFIRAQFCGKAAWDSMIDYHTIDVCSLVELLIIQGKLPRIRKLVDVARHFGIDVAQAHDAAYDNYLCRTVLSRLLAL